MSAVGTFFRSRWIEAPRHMTELPGGLPQGFRAAGVACGIKESGALDLGLIVSDSAQTTSAARFTRSGTLAAPVLLTAERTRLDGIRAVVVNSGNANAATGAPGLENAAGMRVAAASACGLQSEDAVAVASTGVIGVPLPMEPVMSGIAAAAGELAPDGEGAFAEAIRTTDAFPKQCCFDIRLGAGTVRLTAQAKGAGMISPGFATLLVFVQRRVTSCWASPSSARLSGSPSMASSRRATRSSCSAAGSPGSRSSRKPKTSCASVRHSTR